MNIKIKTAFNITKVIDVCIRGIRHDASKVFTKFKAWQKAHQKHRKDREVIEHLLEFNDRDLNDIGISRADIIWASKLPRDQIATYELQKIARAKHN